MRSPLLYCTQQPSIPSPVPCLEVPVLSLGSAWRTLHWFASVGFFRLSVMPLVALLMARVQFRQGPMLHPSSHQAINMLDPTQAPPTLFHSNAKLDAAPGMHGPADRAGGTILTARQVFGAWIIGVVTYVEAICADEPSRTPFFRSHPRHG